MRGRGRKSRSGAVAAAPKRLLSRIRTTIARFWLMGRSSLTRLAGTRLVRAVAAKGLRYWIVAGLIFIAAFEGSPWVYDKFGLHDVKAFYLQFLLDNGPHATIPKFVRLVLIGDEEYWSDELAGRKPLNRKYLAKLVASLESANAHVIALDIDVRLQDATAKSIPPVYREETCDLLRAIQTAAHGGKKLVLATPISFNERREYRRDPDVYQVNGLCRSTLLPPADEGTCKIRFEPAEQANITCGYIGLPYDNLAVPTQITMEDGSRLDSFALAIARATEPDVTRQILTSFAGRLPYGNFMSLETFASYHAQVSAGKVIDNTFAPVGLAAKVAIVGANWHTWAAAKGPLVDLHRTAAGDMVGAVLHANYVEALLDSRTPLGVPKWVLVASEIAFGVFAAIVFVVYPRFWGLGAFVPLIALMFVAQWAVLHGFGLYFDVVVPLVGLALHSFGERLVGHQMAARHRPVA